MRAVQRVDRKWSNAVKDRNFYRVNRGKMRLYA